MIVEEAPRSMEKKTLKIAIDGPCGVGKSTTAIELAKRLGFTRVDSGMLYRALTCAVINRRSRFQNQNSFDDVISPEEAESHKKYIMSLLIHEENSIFHGFVVHVNNLGTEKDYTFEILEHDLRTRVVEKNVSVLAKLPFFREKVGNIQRKIIESSFPGVIVDGRDIGTVVMPDADIKFFLTASEDVRAARRYKENLEKAEKGASVCVDYDQILVDIKERDYNDINRKHGPLKKANDAISIDNSDMTLSEQVDVLYKHIMAVLSKK